MIAEVAFFTKGDDFLCTFVIKPLVFFISGDSRVVVYPSKDDSVHKADGFENLAEALVYQVWSGIRLYAYLSLTTRIMQGF